VTSKNDVEIVREIYDAVARRDFESVLALYDPEVVWDFSRSPYSSVAGASVYHGLEGLRQWWRDWGEAWADYEDRLKDVFEAGKHVVCAIDTTGRGRASGAPVEMEQFGVWTLRDGKVTHVAWFASREDALRAAEQS
jgi:ketosteroid isomerase-like protein